VGRLHGSNRSDAYSKIYSESRNAILDEWNESGPADRKFLEEAVVLFI
jgi:hypothetical protein